MSFRDVPDSDDETFKAWIRKVDDFIASSEAGNLHRGRVSFDRTLLIGAAKAFVHPFEPVGGNPYTNAVAFAAIDDDSQDFSGPIAFDAPELPFQAPGLWLVQFGGQLWAGEGAE